MDRTTDKIISSETDVHFERDKHLIPYLLSLRDISFLGTEITSSFVYFKFAPADKVDLAINSYYARQAPLVQPKDLLDNVERFRNELLLAKNHM